MREHLAKKLLELKLAADKWSPTIKERRKYKGCTVPKYYYPIELDDKPVLVGTCKGKGVVLLFSMGM